MAGADPTVRNYSGNTALHLACMRGDLLCATALTESLTPRERRDALSKHEKKVPALPQNLEQINYVGKCTRRSCFVFRENKEVRKAHNWRTIR